MAVAFALNILLLASVVGGLSSRHLYHEEVPDLYGPSEVWVDPDMYWDLRYNTEAAAIGKANALLSGMILGDVPTLDTAKGFGALYREYDLDGGLYWKLYDGQTECLLNAESGEIVRYRTSPAGLHWPDPWALAYSENFGVWTSTSAEWRNATTLALAVAGQFARIPEDLDLPATVTDRSFSVNVDDDGSGVPRHVDTRFWTTFFPRVHHGVVTEDRLTVRLDSEGRLEYYCKEWTMDLAGVPTVPRLNATQAFAALTRYWFGEALGMAAFPNSTAGLAIIDDWGEMGDPFEELKRSWEAPTTVLTWHIALYTHHDIPDQAWVDAITGRIVRDAMLD